MKLNGRWFPQIVDRDSGNLYLIYPPLPCSDFVSQVWGWVGVSKKQLLEKRYFVISCFLKVLCYFPHSLEEQKFPREGCRNKIVAFSF